MKCACQLKRHPSRLVVITGGPGAGKTAVLEATKKMVCEHVTILPESASVIFSGGFLRHATPAGHRSAQRTIFHVQRELERMTEEEGNSALILCDRGTLDGLAYWPDTEALFWQEVGSDRKTELARYHTVIHLHPPDGNGGYNNENPFRIESASEAQLIDQRIVQAWEGHPRRFFIPAKANFIEKMSLAAELIRKEIPDCCRQP